MIFRQVSLVSLVFSASLATGRAETTPKARGQGVLLLGDSLMRVGVGPVLKRAIVQELGQDVTMAARSATGLARPDTYDWSKAAKSLLAKKRFAKAIVFLGSNDCQALYGSKDPVAYGTEAWDKGYRSRVKDFMNTLCSSIDQVLWLELPPMRSAKFNHRIAALNALLASEVGSSKCGRFVHLASSLADSDGKFSSFQKIKQQRLKIREDDGVHLTQNGGRIVTDAVLIEIKR